MKREELLQIAKPILFNTDMVRAILNGRKTVTRRLVGEKTCIIRPDQEISKNLKGQFELYNITPRCGIPQNVLFKPPYQPGDILYVRETIWQKVGHYLDIDGESKPSWYKEFKYAATDEKPETGWNYTWAKRPSIHMPKEAARIFLKVMDVKVERLQDMTQIDFMNEGVNTCKKCSCKDACLGLSNYRICYLKSDFIKIWDSTIKKSDIDRYGWDANPWVWVIEIERVVEE